MAYWINESGNSNNSNYREFGCDKLADIPKLPTSTTEGEYQENDSVASKPCAVGSTCICLENSSVWMLGKEPNEWSEL